ncbi:MAG: PAS domain-containing protein [Anaerolineae bacterium]|nr:MAG: PAS domain-containing protein [Anaerolineae bacterium]
MKRVFMHWRQALPPALVAAAYTLLLGAQRHISLFPEALLLFAVVYLTAAWCVEALLRPLRDLQEQMHAREPRPVERYTGVQHPDISALRNAFGEMLTRIRQQAHARATEESRLHAVLEQMRDGVLILDSDGMVHVCNRSAARMFGITRQQATGMSLARLSRDYRLVNLWQQSAQGRLRKEITLNTGLMLQVTITPLSGVLQNFTLVLLRDVTRLRRLEAVRRDFISNISHELRTPLASLQALADTLQEGALDDPPAARRFLEMMQTEVAALTQMVNELVELSRIESGRVPLHRRAVAPEALLHRAASRLEVQAERKGVQVQVECPPALPDVLADPERIGQVLVNLLHNAIKFTPQGGHITLEARPTEKGVIFRVQDTGMGIPSEALPRIFERFYKADQSRSGGGTGLGLAICKHLVEAHGSKIGVESTEGHGSVFFFTLPDAK